MSRYSLKPYQSVYRDPQSVAINTLQRQKFQQAFNADDAIAGAVDQMQAADFEGDQALKMELEQNTRQQLQDRAARGDYETMVLDVSKSAREFDKNYQPIKQNYEMYQAYKKRVQDAYNKGDINALTYNKALAKSNFGYSGLERNEDGSIDDGSFFNGYNFVKDVDIQALMSEAMKDYAAKEGGQVVQQVGQGPDAMFTIKVGEKYKTVPKKDVQAIFDNVMARPDVSASVAQQVDLTTFDVTDEQIRQRLTASLYGDENDPNNNGLIGLRDKALADGNDKLAAQIDEKIQKEINLLSGAGLESEEERMQARAKYLKDETLSGIIGSERDMAVRKFAYENIFSEQIVDYDKMFLVGLKSKLDKAVPTVYYDTGMTQIDNAGGKSQESVNTYIQNYKDSQILVENDATVRARELGLIGEDQRITADDIMNGRVPEQFKQKDKNGNSILKSMQEKISHARLEINLQERRLREAENQSGFTANQLADAEREFATTDFKGTIGVGSQSINGKQLVDSVSKLLGRTVTTSEAIKFVGDAMKNRNKRVDTLFADVEDNITGNQMLTSLAKILNEDYNKNFGSLNGLPDATINDIIRFNAGFFKRRTDEIDKWLDENSTVETSGMTSTTFPGENDPLVQANTQAVKSAFENRVLDPNFEIFYNGQKQDGYGNVQTMIEDLDLDTDKPIKVTQVTFDTTPYLGEPSLQFTTNAIDPKTGNPVIVKVPYSNMKQAGMEQYFQNPVYKTQLEVNKSRLQGLPSADIGFYDENGVYKGHHQYNFDANKNITSVTVFGLKEDANGNMVPYVEGSYPPNSTILSDDIYNIDAAGLTVRTMLK
tara:strand:+ start:85 stop:2571 length:2487 start_codon:yes stop_codon:yes gene_type:complete